MCTKAFLPAGGAAVVSIPTYAMYRVHAEQRGGARRSPSRACRRPQGWAMDVPAVRAAAREADARLGVQPEQPDRPRGAGRRDRAPARGDRRGRGGGRPARAGRRRRRGVQRVRRRRRVIPLRARFPNLVVVRTASKAYAMAGPAGRVRRRARRRRSRRIALYRPPGLDRDDLGHRRRRGRCASPATWRRTSRASLAERPRLAAAPRRRSAGTRSRRSPTSSCSTS